MADISFPETSGNMAERLSGVVAEYGGIRLYLRPGGLEYMQSRFIDTLFAKPQGTEESDDDFSARLVDVVMARDNWALRFCVERAEGVDLDWETRKIGKKEYRVLCLDTLDRIPHVLRDAAVERINEMSGLSQAEKDKVVFTSASPAT